MPTAQTLIDCHINGEPKTAGDVVEVCENTFRNLIRDGKLKPFEPETDKPFAETSAKSPKLRTR